MSPPTQTFFVTGATGSQGGATARYLLSGNHKVHALVRNPTSPSALDLQSLGAVLFPGDFDSPTAIAAACTCATSVFINTFPQMVPGAELQHAKNIVSAALASKTVTSLVYSSAILTGQHDSFPGFQADSWMGTYFLAKHGIEELVRGSGLQWTILRPAMLMKSFVPPNSDFNFPDLGKEGVLLTAYKPDIQLTVFSEKDVGAFAAEAMLNPAGWHGKEITLGAEKMGLEDIARQLTEACGKRIVVKFRTEEEVEALRGKHPIVDSQIMSNDLDFSVDVEGLVEKFGIKLTSLKEYLEEHKEEVHKAFSF
ncbi:unnamed protein product [Calypogeia fissa]